MLVTRRVGVEWSGDLSLATAAGQVNCHKGNTFCFVNFKIYADTWQSLWQEEKGAERGQRERVGGIANWSSAVCRSGAVNYLVLAGELLLPLKLHVSGYRCFIMSCPHSCSLHPPPCSSSLLPSSCCEMHLGVCRH